MADLRRGGIKALDIIPKEQRADALTAWLIERIAGLYRIGRQFIDATPE